MRFRPGAGVGLTILCARIAGAQTAATIATIEHPITIATSEQAGTTTLYLTRVEPPASGNSTGAAQLQAEVRAAGSVAVGALASTSKPPLPPIVLGAGMFSAKTSKEILPGQLRFACGSPEPATSCKVELAPGQTRAIEVSATGILFDGEAEVDILDHGHPLGSLTVTRAPLAVALTEASTFQPGQVAALTLSNDSRYAAAFRWMLQLDAAEYCGDQRKDCTQAANWMELVIPPKGKAIIDVQVPERSPWFGRNWLSRFILGFSSRTEKATLWLDPGTAFPKHDVHFDARLQGSSYPGETFWVVCFLALGALFSLLVRHWVPNLQRKRDLKERARQTCRKAEDFSSLIPSQLREHIRAQCALLQVLLHSTWTILPDYATVATQCAQALGLLERRVDLIAEMDAVRQKFGAYWDRNPPPTQVDRVDAELDIVADGLAKVQPSETDLAAIRQALDRAKAFVAEMGAPDSTFAAALGERVRNLRADAKALQQAATEPDVKLQVAALIATVSELCPPADTNSANGSIPLERQSQLDYSLRALEIWREYLWLVKSVNAEDKAALDAVRGQLIVHLARHSWNELYLAQRELRQFREHCSPADVLREIPQRIHIAYEPRELTYPQLVNFRIRFRRDELNWCAARDAITPEWGFETVTDPRAWSKVRSQRGAAPPAREPASKPDAGAPATIQELFPRIEERGSWEVSHVFLDRRSWWQRRAEGLLGDWIPHERQERVCVRFRACDEVEPRAERDAEATIELRIPVKLTSSPDRRSRLFGEVLSLGVAVLIPLVSLVAGAKQQLAQSSSGGALVVFLLGFGSDAIISVFKQRAPQV